MAREASAILLAAGAGTRLGAGRTKALVPVAGRPLVWWSAAVLAGIPRIVRVVLVVPGDPVAADDIAAAAREAGLDPVVVCGGARRRDSVRAGLGAVERGIVAVHDAARPLADAELYGRVLDAASASGAAVPAVPVADTVVEIRGDEIARVPDRTRLRAVQTPQAFDAELLRRAHEAADPGWDAPDDASLVVAAGTAVRLVPGAAANRKLTWPEDMTWFEGRLAAGRSG
ncbi:MAG: 2-C-methyl-D-erythritol 4-phosphate cytidylyltransferase [Acidobacteria bacterium]|nr:MAG: 2-C-methyl-D-erythritol 4-phosphate cytidylyltransferase [Acidobacteriota bacterium]